jgi:hypothetical protein
MTVPEILKALESPGRKFPEAAVKAAVEQREAITPELLRTVAAVADDPAAYARRYDYLLHLFALYLLAQFGERRAYPLVLRLVGGPSQAVDNLLGDTITEGLSCITASVFDGELEPLIRVVLNPQVNEFARGSLISALVLLHFEDQLTRAQLVEILQRFWRELEPEDIPGWTAVVCAVGDAGLRELIPQVREAFAAGRVNPDMTTFELLRADVFRPRHLLVSKFKTHNHLVRDTAEEMSWWACWDEESEAEFDPAGFEDDWTPEPGDSPPPPEAAVSAAPKIGRNDPCPCGSGKKYKKCCLGKPSAADPGSG